jgi:hypothetical protein
MANNIDRAVFLGPMSYALSGDFNPAADPGRAHTLMGLVLAAYQKGERIGYRAPHDADIDYAPSWAPGVKVTTQWDEDGRNELFRGLHLSDRQGNRFGWAQYRHGAGLLTADIAHSTIRHEETNLSLEPGAELSATRRLLAEKAQFFFDLAHQAVANEVASH